jgi:hypothetical protein
MWKPYVTNSANLFVQHMPSNPCKDFRIDRGIVRLAGETSKTILQALMLGIPRT